MGTTVQEKPESDAFSRLFLGEMKICIHRMEGNIPCGSIFSCYIDDKIEFRGIADMILKLDALCDFLGSPKAETERKSIGSDRKNRNFCQIPVRRRHEFNDFAKTSGEITSFYIRLRYRRNVSWQGSIRFANDGELYQFRSVLELMGYLDERLGLKSGKQEDQ